MKTDKKLFIETYGCQMNFSDSEIVASILSENDFSTVDEASSADLILINTCSVRDKAEQRVWKRLKELRAMKKKNPNLKIGVIGCMAERLKDQLFETEAVVDLVAGPDAYRDLPSLIDAITSGQRAANIQLSIEETYEDVEPVRYDSNGISAFISIMRGCENFCSYCVVPFTRGKERSRNPETILNEAERLFNEGYREITLLGQNVNSYHWEQDGDSMDFPRLLASVAEINPLLRVRFTTSHPKDLSDKLIETISLHPNICRSIHLAVQSGSTSVLEQMNRKYTREWYMNRISAIKALLPDCAISTDIIAGFCGETDKDHQQTLSLMEWVPFDYAFMFKYSVRSGTIAEKKFTDDVPEAVKAERLKEIISLQQKLSLRSNKKDIGKVFEVLVEGVSKKSVHSMMGRNSQNKVVVFESSTSKPGEYTLVKITSCTPATLIGEHVN
ncbi:MAG: tRNA (N6-isopentenyl adenosine(37)-C2)-methylthiotransferase MiaB [Bacteroidales bacterium]|nr:tRNA (N6-isopentenyl adenosine(37)-C2)-methylthiotransferase MiaB [Bacteroidales bacterium]